MQHHSFTHYSHMKSPLSAALSPERKLHAAIEEGSLAEVEQQLENGASVNCLINGLTPTAHAIIAKQGEIAVKLLTSHNADVHQGQRTFHPHFHFRLSPDIVPSRKDSNHVPLLHMAVSHGFIDIVEELLGRGADINATDDVNSETALHFAVASGQSEMVELLLEHRPNVNRMDIESQAPIHLAVKLPSTRIAQALLSAGATANLPGPLDQLPLHIACSETNNEDIVRLLLKVGSMVNVQDCLHMSPLHYAAKGGNLAVIRMLLQHQADASVLDHVLDTPLHKAVEHGHIDVVEELLRHGHGDPNAESGQGPMCKLPLQTAVATGSIELVDKLLEYGAHISQRDSVYDETALHWAVQRGDVKITEHLIQKGAEVNHYDSHASQSPLYIACMRDDEEGAYGQIVQLLLQYGANINYIPRGYQHHHYGAAIHIVASRGLLKMADILTTNPEIDLNILDWDDQTPLRIAMKQGDADMAKILVQAGCYINSVHCKKTDLEYAMCLGSYATARLLVQHGADVVYPPRLVPTCSPLEMLFRSESITDIARSEVMRALVHTLIAAGDKFSPDYDFSALLCNVIHAQEISIANILESASPCQPCTLFCLSVVLLRKQLQLSSRDVSIVSHIKKLPLPNLMKDELLLQHN